MTGQRVTAVNRAASVGTFPYPAALPTVVTIPHGMGDVPDQVFVTFRNVDGPSAYGVQNLTDNTFDLHLAAPAAAGLLIDWLAVVGCPFG